MIGQTSSRFWKCFANLPERIQFHARKNFEFWKHDPWQPSLQFKEVKPQLWSVRIGSNYRALAAFDGTSYVWFWIVTHDEYLRLIGSL